MGQEQSSCFTISVWLKACWWSNHKMSFLKFFTKYISSFLSHFRAFNSPSSIINQTRPFLNHLNWHATFHHILDLVHFSNSSYLLLFYLSWCLFLTAIFLNILIMTTLIYNMLHLGYWRFSFIKHYLERLLLHFDQCSSSHKGQSRTILYASNSSAKGSIQVIKSSHTK